MTTRIPNSLGKLALIIGLSVSCVLFQFMFFGLIHLYCPNPNWLPDGVDYSADVRTNISAFCDAMAEARSAVDIICLLNFPVIIVHLALICYVALRKPRCAAALEG